MTPVSLATALLEEARSVEERRLIVLAGDRETGYATLEAICRAVPVGIGETTLVGPADRLRCEQVPQSRARTLLGTTRTIVAFDAHQELRPSALGAVTGAVDGGGLLVLLTPRLAEWPDTRDAFDERLAVPPHDLQAVTGYFRSRLVETLRTHPGIGIVDVEDGSILSSGLTHPAARLKDPRVEDTDIRGAVFPVEAYEACRSDDQRRALQALESLGSNGPTALVLEADRGRGKSSVAGIAAACLLAAGTSVVVTAPERANVGPLFDRAQAVLEALGVAVSGTAMSLEVSEATLTYQSPERAADGAGGESVVVVDEAAALPVRRLEALLAADRVAFATTVHGYEGTGRGFDVRFRDRLETAPHEVIDVTLAEPIRYAAGDPIEVWSFRALLLDARPAPGQLLAGLDVEGLEHRRVTSEELASDESLCRQVFGLLVLAHYRTEPDDLARLLDAPNLRVHALFGGPTVAGVALVAREGGLSRSIRRGLYRGERIPGHMIPDLLTSHCRDRKAGVPTGDRIVRIATHESVRSRGVGSRLLRGIEARSDADWVGAGFGATADLVRFWTDNGYTPVATSTTANDRSGEHSVIVLKGQSAAGRSLQGRHADLLRERIPRIASSTLAEVDPATLEALCRGLSAGELSLSSHEWRLVVGAAHGPGMLAVDPGPFRRLVVHWLADSTGPTLPERETELLVRLVLQDRRPTTVAGTLEYPSRRACMRALGVALEPLVDHYGPPEAHRERDRLRD